MQTALITGANRGIGLALTSEFLGKGWRVIAGTRQPDSAALRALADTHSSVLHILAMDVLSEASCQAAASHISAFAPSLDVLVNNAAVFPGDGSESFQLSTAAMYNEAFDCNVAGVVRVTQAMLPQLQSGARVANISSLAGSIAEIDSPGYYSYGVSKAALNMLTRIMSFEFAQRNIVVTAISPGWVRTDMGGQNAPLSPEESAAALYETITTLDASMSGTFIDRNGALCAW